MPRFVCIVVVLLSQLLTAFDATAQPNESNSAPTTALSQAAGEVVKNSATDETPQILSLDALPNGVAARLEERFRTDTGTAPPMILIPSGSYQKAELNMADVPADDAPMDAKPGPVIQIRKPFYIGLTEVTQEQWAKAMGTESGHLVSCATCPVEAVSTEELAAFIEKLNVGVSGLKTKPYRLPTASEWEWACRGGVSDTRYCGSNDIEQVAWFGHNSGGVPHPVASRTPNGFGLFDMTGSVRELVEDCFDSDNTTDSRDERPRSNCSDGALRITRGGGYSSGFFDSHYAFPAIWECQKFCV